MALLGGGCHTPGLCQCESEIVLKTLAPSCCWRGGGRTPENMMAAVVGVSLHDCAGFESKHQSDCARPTRADQHAAMSRR